MGDAPVLSTVRDDVIRDYARLLGDGWCGPSEFDDRMVSRGEPDDEQRLWLIDLAALAAADGLGVAETGENVGGEFFYLNAILRRPDGEPYRLPVPPDSVPWREEVERDWGSELRRARERVALEIARREASLRERPAG